jgi:Holliday junction resolvase RusA-like endonuclease
MDEPFEIEECGDADKIKPMFGTWSQKFELEPVSYSNQGPARATFKQAVRDQLKNKFVFVCEVQLVIRLYLDEQKVLETPRYGDLDNYAKQILDSIKGHGGLFIDDCQVQHLDISWIDVPYGAHFDLEINSSPDDWLHKSLKLYEMPDSLYYPIPNQILMQDGRLTEVTDEVFSLMAKALAKMTETKRHIRHQLRLGGMPQFRAYQYAKHYSPILMGFHRSRVEDSGYELIRQTSWINLIR